MSNWYITPSDNDLMHYGVLGMKWGVRRYQNKDGSFTPAGIKRYSSSLNRLANKANNPIESIMIRKLVKDFGKMLPNNDFSKEIIEGTSKSFKALPEMTKESIKMIEELNNGKDAFLKSVKKRNDKVRDLLITENSSDIYKRYVEAQLNRDMTDAIFMTELYGIK